jgi:hypothetical protein
MNGNFQTLLKIEFLLIKKKYYLIWIKIHQPSKYCTHGLEMHKDLNKEHVQNLTYFGLTKKKISVSVCLVKTQKLKFSNILYSYMFILKSTFIPGFILN